METAVVEAEKLRTLVGEDRGTALNSLASFIRDFLEAKHKRYSTVRSFSVLRTLSKRTFRTIFGSSIATICYVVTKWLEVINAFGQLYMLSCFVGQGDFFWGYHVGEKSAVYLSVFSKNEYVLSDLTFLNLYSSHVQERQLVRCAWWSSCRRFLATEPELTDNHFTSCVLLAKLLACCSNSGTRSV